MSPNTRKWFETAGGNFALNWDHSPFLRPLLRNHNSIVSLSSPIILPPNQKRVSGDRYQDTMTTSATSTPLPWLTATFSYANMFTVGTLYAASALHAELPRSSGISPDWAMASFESARVGLSVGLSKAAALIDRHCAPRVAGRGAMLMTGLSTQYASFASIIAAFFLGGIGVGWTYLIVVITVSQALPQSLVHLHQQVTVDQYGWNIME